MGVWQQSCYQSSNTNMARNNLQQHPESINSDRERRGRSRRRNSSTRTSTSSTTSPNESCDNCTRDYSRGWGGSCTGGSSSDNSSRSEEEGSVATQLHNQECGTIRVRIGNIAATYLFIGLLLLQSGYLCHGTYLLPTILIYPQPPSWVRSPMLSRSQYW